MHSRGQSIASPPWPEEGLASGDNGVRRTGQKIILLALFLFVLWMAQSYLVAAAWGTVIAIAVWPLYQYVANAISRLAPVSARRNWLAALLTTIATALILAVPVSVGLSEIARQAQAVVNWIGQAQQAGIEVPDWVKRLPLLGERLSDRHALGSLLNNIDMDRLAVWASGLSGAFTHLLLIALLTLMTLYFLLRDGTAISDRLAMLAKFWLGQPGEAVPTGACDSRARRREWNCGRGGRRGLTYQRRILVGQGAALCDLRNPYDCFRDAASRCLGRLHRGDHRAAPEWRYAACRTGTVRLGSGRDADWRQFRAACAHRWCSRSLVAILGGIETFGLVGVFLGPIIMAAFLTALREWTYNKSL